jgi:hypothetical protein
MSKPPLEAPVTVSLVSNVTSSSAETGSLALVLQGKGKHLSVRAGPIVVDVTIVIGIHL